MNTEQARQRLNSHVREMMRWHFSPETGTPFWLDAVAGNNPALELDFDPIKEIQCLEDLGRFGFFDEDWLRGGPLRRWVPKAFQNRPIYAFETGYFFKLAENSALPKMRVVVEDLRIDYENFSETLPDEFFPKGANWLMLGPLGPRRLRLGVEYLCQYRGGICFFVDLDPCWPIKLINHGQKQRAVEYQDHVIDQALTVLKAGHDVKCLFATPKLLQALANALKNKGSSIAKAGITGIFSGGTEYSQQFARFAAEELLDGESVYLAPTYGNALTGLACSLPSGPGNDYKVTCYAPQPRAVIQVVDFDDAGRVVEYGQAGRLCLTALTRDFFMPRFIDDDEGVREFPCERFPWDGISGIKPFCRNAATSAIGVY